MTTTCACGCGTRIYPNMYAFCVAGRFYAQKCVTFGPVASLHQPDPVTVAAATAEIDSEHNRAA